MTPARLKAIALLVVVFALGAVAGAGATFSHMRREMAEFAFPPGLRPPKARMRALSHQLDLSSDQQDKVRAILERHQQDRRVLWDELMVKCGDSIRKQKADIDGEVRAVLTPAQQPKFDEIAKRQNDRFFEPHSPR
jgi:Spy/CpxP family protein refolding chaperone